MVDVGSNLKKSSPSWKIVGGKEVHTVGGKEVDTVMERNLNRIR